MNDVFPVVVSLQRQPEIRLSRRLLSLETGNEIQENAWPPVLKKKRGVWTLV